MIATLTRMGFVTIEYIDGAPRNVICAITPNTHDLAEELIRKNPLVFSHELPEGSAYAIDANSYRVHGCLTETVEWIEGYKRSPPKYNFQPEVFTDCEDNELVVL